MKAKKVWTLHYGAPVEGVVTGPSKRIGWVLVEVRRGRARIAVSHQEIPTDLFPTYQLAYAARRKARLSKARADVKRAREKLRTERKDAVKSKRYHAAEEGAAIARLLKAQRTLEKELRS